MNKPTAVVLAGGEGKRFAPLVTNKTLFPFLGKPWLTHFFRQLENAGFESVIISCSPDNKAWIDSYQTKMKITTVIQPKPLGMADSLLLLEEKIGQQEIVVMNAVDFVDDSLFPQLLSQVANYQIAIVGMKVEGFFPGGYLIVQGNKVKDIVEKPEPGKEPSDLVNLVFHYYANSRALFDVMKKIPESGADDVYEKALSALMRSEDVGFIEYQGAWAKLKYPHLVLSMMDQLLKTCSRQIDESVQIAETAIIQGDVMIEAGAKIMDFAVIKGSCYIGKNTIIGNHCLVVSSNIEANCVIGAGSEVTRSYLGERTWLHHNFVGDSVLEADINPSYGTVFTNLRLDKKPVKLASPLGLIETGRDKLGSILAKGVFSGVNCSFMPGTAVGANARIVPGSIVKGYIPANSWLDKT